MRTTATRTTCGIGGRCQCGSASLLMVGVMGVVTMLGSAAIVVAGYLAAHHRARDAADLAALSGAAAYQQGQNPCRQADRTARGNGATVEHCDQVGDQIGFVVTVRVAVPVRLRIPGLPRTAEAEAYAGPAY
jgi:secretion/DNA translocation related TadE-like protein